MAAKKRTSVYYIDNKRFYEEMKKYIESCREAVAAEKEIPIIPNYIGECFYKIATKLSNKPNFMNYSYKDEMIGDGIENCIHYIKSFNPDKSTNPFSYFTQIVWHSFIHRIQKEKKQQYVKYKSMQNMLIHNENFSSQDSDGGHIISAEFHENTQRFIATFENNIQKNKKKKEEKKALENFIED